MKLHNYTMAVIAGALALQVAPCQGGGGVSMVVSSAIGTTGYVCEPFECLPNQTLGVPGETLKVGIFGRALSPYILFVGWPAVGCMELPPIIGGLAVWAPVTLEIGAIGDTGGGSPCGVDYATTVFQVPTNAPLGVQLRLQAIAEAPTDEGYAFTRAMEIHIR